VTSDSNENWSEKTSKYFCSLVTPEKLFRTSLVSYQIDTDQYIIDLFEKNISLSKLLLAGGYAKSISA
jgi:hypothetical protein